MHGLSPEEEIDYWRERARRAEAELPGEAATIDAIVEYLRERYPAAAVEIDHGHWRKETR